MTAPTMPISRSAMIKKVLICLNLPASQPAKRTKIVVVVALGSCRSSVLKVLKPKPLMTILPNCTASQWIDTKGNSFKHGFALTAVSAPFPKQVRSAQEATSHVCTSQMASLISPLSYLRALSSWNEDTRLTAIFFCSPVRNLFLDGLSGRNIRSTQPHKNVSPP